MCLLPLLGAALVPFASCRAPTEITLVVSTDVKCADLRGTSITVGRIGEIETKAPTTSSTFCDAASGDLGALVVVPSGGKGDEVAMKIIAGRGRDADACVPPYGKGCIVARRALHYLPHTGLRIAVPLRAACDGVPCGETETCVSGACAPAEIADPSACSGAKGCDEGALGPATGGDGGADATMDGGVDAAIDGGVDGSPIVTPTYHDMSNPSLWSTFDLGTVNAGTGFWGAAFDGRYVYLVPNNNGAVDGIVARYDTQAPFATSGSWTTFDTTTVNAGAKGFNGAAFDGRYVYLVPNLAGVVARYDTQAPFATGASWTTFDTTTVNAGAKGFLGAAFDGRYVYLVANYTVLVARYDTQAPFATGASWTMFDTTVNAGARGFIGAAFDGRYVYFVPYINGPFDGLVVRYDSLSPFATRASWTTFDIATVKAAAAGFAGAAFDGRYVYFVPAAGSIVARFDAKTPPSMPKLPGFSGSFL